MPACPHCGGNHPAQARFCPKTGKPIVLPAETSAPAAPIAPEIPPAGLDANHAPAPAKQPKKAPNPLYLLIAGGALTACLGAAVIAAALLLDAPASIRQAGIVLPTQPGAALALATSTLPAPAEASTEPPAAADAPPAVSQNTAAPSLTPAPTATVTPTPEPTRPAFPSQANPKDQATLVFVSAGKFIMGSDPEVDPYFWGAESPRHEVTLKEYWIYQTEVTNAMYQRCVEEKACPLPSQKKNRLDADYYGNPRYENYPVIYVNWASAQSYCRWAGGRLPTEAEWEKAARGDQDTRLFPWGNAPATESLANFCDAGCAQTQADRNQDDGYPNTAPVGSYPEGISPYGALDMAGNVWEWVFDWFQPTYGSTAVEDPVGPASSKYRTIRGGSWSNPSAGVRIVQREGLRPDLSLDGLGFRCVVEVQP